MRTTLAVSLFACSLAQTVAQAEPAFAIDSRNTLVRFDTNTPFFVDSARTIRGLAPGETVLGIDFRPANNQLYALGSSSRLYTINRDTAVATAIGAAPFTPALEGTEFGFDFNPTVDRIRVISNTGQNLRLHPDTGAVAAVDTRLNYPNGIRTLVSGAAYTNNVPAATTTTLYVIDPDQRTLNTQIPPNDGRLNVVANVPVDLSDLVGFDISGRTGRAYLASRVRGRNASGLWEIDLKTGAATQLGSIEGQDQISGLAIPAN